MAQTVSHNVKRERDIHTFWKFFVFVVHFCRICPATNVNCNALHMHASGKKMTNFFIPKSKKVATTTKNAKSDIKCTKMDS